MNQTEMMKMDEKKVERFEKRLEELKEKITEDSVSLSEKDIGR